MKTVCHHGHDAQHPWMLTPQKTRELEGSQGCKAAPPPPSLPIPCTVRCGHAGRWLKRQNYSPARESPSLFGAQNELLHKQARQSSMALIFISYRRQVLPC